MKRRLKQKKKFLTANMAGRDTGCCISKNNIYKLYNNKYFSQNLQKTN